MLTTPGDVLSYADLWRITIVNYHTGYNLVGDVLIQMYSLDQETTWDNFALTLNLMAPGVLAYVHAVTGEIQAEIPLNVILCLACHVTADSLKPYTVPSVCAGRRR